MFLFDTINRTRWSFLLTIVALQWFGVGGICPPNTHDWRLYITPAEIADLADARALRIGELRGLQIALSPSLVWAVLSGGLIAPEHFTVGVDTSANYIGYAIKE